MDGGGIPCRSGAHTIQANLGAPRFSCVQITLGVASYGRSYRVSPAAALDGQQILPFPKFNATDPPPGPEDDPSYVDTCGNHTGVNGEFTFSELISAGFLLSNGTQAPGIDYTLDSCSKTVGGVNLFHLDSLIMQLNSPTSTTRVRIQ